MLHIYWILNTTYLNHNEIKKKITFTLEKSSLGATSTSIFSSKFSFSFSSNTFSLFWTFVEFEFVAFWYDPGILNILFNGLIELFYILILETKDNYVLVFYIHNKLFFFSLSTYTCTVNLVN